LISFIQQVTAMTAILLTDRYDERLKVRMVFEKESDPGVPLVLETDAEGLIGATEAASCRAPGTRCAPLYASDYVTELSLWE
jgi:hypothetical protein